MCGLRICATQGDFQMKPLYKYTLEELQLFKLRAEKDYAAYCKKGLSLDMSRGKPGVDQLSVSNGVLDAITSKDWENSGEMSLDYRNYGVLRGIWDCRKMFAQLFEVDMENVIVCGNSSLNMMFDYVTQCMLKGAGDKPWFGQKIKFLCPVPGYDRHFAICEYYDIEMVNVPMLEDGPDMDIIEELVKDESVKGMFCVPKYSNPTGITFSKAVVDRIARLEPAAKDFRIIWDNAYCIHDLTNNGDTLVNIFPLLKKYRHDDMVVEFTSTSKVSFPGSGVAALTASDNNIAMITERMRHQTIGYDKLNQYRHVKFYRNADGLREHMKLHRRILAPKFHAVIDELESQLSGLDIATWTHPHGGYFINFDVMPGTATRVGELCKNAGVVLTPVGATFPYGKDPEDKNIRIAPSYPPVNELLTATKLLCICTKLAAVEKLLEQRLNTK